MKSDAYEKKIADLEEALDDKQRTAERLRELILARENEIRVLKDNIKWLQNRLLVVETKCSDLIN